VQTTPRDQFLDAVRSAGPLWRACDFRIVAVRSGREWHAIFAHGALCAETPRRVRRSRALPDSDVVRGWQLVRPLEELESLLSAVEQGRLAVDANTEVAFDHRPGDGAPAGGIRLGTFYLHELARGPRRDLQWPAYVLAGYGPSSNDLITRTPGGWPALDDALRAQAHPVRDLEALAAAVSGRRHWFQLGANVTVEWIAPLQARLDRDVTALRGGRVRYRVLAGSRAALRATTLAVRGEPLPTGQGRGLSARIRLTSARALPHAEGFAIEGYEGTDGATSVSLALRVGSVPVEWLERRDFLAGGRNARLAAYASVDAELTWLRGLLAGGGRKGERHLPVAVARLLTLCGLHADPLEGLGALTDGVDVLAYDPTGDTCLAIECTSGSLDGGGKLGKLLRRAGELRRAVPELRVIAVLATLSQPEDLSKAEWGAATGDGVRVLHGGSLQHLLALAERNTPASEVLAYVEAGAAPDPAATRRAPRD
jgi:hypothetical protein